MPWACRIHVRGSQQRCSTGCGERVAGVQGRGLSELTQEWMQVEIGSENCAREAPMFRSWEIWEEPTKATAKW